MKIVFLNTLLYRLYKAEEEAQTEEELISISRQIEETRLLIAQEELNGTVAN